MAYDKQVLEELRAMKSALLNSTSILEEQSKQMDDQSKALISIAENFKGSKGTDDGATSASSKGFRDFVKDLSEFSTMLPKFTKNINKFVKAPTEKFIEFFDKMTKAITLDGKYEKPSEIGKLYKEIGKAFAILGPAIGKFAMGVFKFSLADKTGAPKRFMNFLSKFFNSSFLSSLNPAMALKAGRAMLIISKAITRLALSLLIAGPLLLIGIPSLVITIPVLTGVMMLFSVLGARAKLIRRGARSMHHMSVGFLAFTGALILMKAVSGSDIAKSVLVIGVFSLFVAAIQLVSKLGGPLSTPKKMGRAIMAMALGFGVFTLSIAAAKAITTEDIGKAALVVLLIGGLSAVMSVFGGAKSILTMIAMAGAFVVLTMVVMMYKQVEYDDIKKMFMTVGGALMIVALAGALNQVLMAGSIALIMISGSLLLFSVSFKIFMQSLKMFKGMGWTDEDTGLLVGTITGLIGGVGDMFKGGGFLQGFTTFVTGAGGIGLLGALGVALIPFVKGLEIFKKVKWTEKDSEMIKLSVSSLIMGVKEPFEEIGKSGGFLKRSNFKKGLDSTRTLGKIITKLAEGVQNMASMKFEDADGNMVQLGPKHFEQAGANIKAILTAVKKPLEEIGSESAYKPGQGLVQNMRALFSKTSFKRGVNSVMGLGNFMKKLADGVVAMSSGKWEDAEGNVRTLDSAAFEAAASNMKMVLTIIRSTIEDIGTEAQSDLASGNAFQKIRGLFSGKPAFKKGLNAVMGLGDFMKNLADGVVAMSTGTFTNAAGETIDLNDEHFKNAATRTKLILSHIKGVIEDIGTKDVDQAPEGAGIGKRIGVGAANLFKGNKFKKGIKAVMGLGTFMSELARGVIEMSKNKFQDADGSFVTLGPDTYKKAGANVKKILFAIKEPLSDIKNKDSRAIKNAAKRFAGVGSVIAELADSMKKVQGYSFDDSLKTSIKNMMAAVLDPVKAIAVTEPSMMAYKQVNDLMSKLANVGHAGTKLVTASKNTDKIFKAFGSLESDHVEKLSKLFFNIHEFTKVSGDFSSIANSMERIGNALAPLFTAIADLTDYKMKTVERFMGSLYEIEKITWRTFEKKVDKTIDLFKEIKEVGAADLDALKAFDQVKGIAKEGTEENSIDDLYTKLEMIESYMQQMNEGIAQLVGRLTTGTIQVEQV